jgi:hypothetical protein
MIMDTTNHKSTTITLSFDQPVSFPSGNADGFNITNFNRTSSDALTKFGAISSVTASSAASVPSGQTYSTTWALTVNVVDASGNDNFVYGDIMDITYTPGSDTTQRKVNINSQQLEAVTASSAAYTVTNNLAQMDNTPPTIVSASLIQKTAGSTATGILNIVFSKNITMSSWTYTVFQIYAYTTWHPLGSSAVGQTLSASWNGTAPSSPTNTLSIQINGTDSIKGSSTMQLKYTDGSGTNTGYVITDIAQNKLGRDSGTSPLSATVVLNNYLNTDNTLPTIVSSTVANDANGHAQMTLVFSKAVAMIGGSNTSNADGWTFAMGSTTQNGQTTINAVPSSPSAWGAQSPAAGDFNTVWVLSLQTTGGLPIIGSTMDFFTYAYTQPDAGGSPSQDTRDYYGNLLANVNGTAAPNITSDAGTVSSDTYHPGNTVYISQGHYPYTTSDSYIHSTGTASLVAQYDGIANTADGKDSSHTTSPGSTWPNLISGTRFPAATIYNGAWDSNSFHSASGSSYIKIPIDTTKYSTPYDASTHPFTVEWVGKLDQVHPNGSTWELLYAEQGNRYPYNLWWMGIDNTGLGLDYTDNTSSTYFWNTENIDGITSTIPANTVVQFVVIWDGTLLHTEIRVGSNTYMAQSDPVVASGNQYKKGADSAKLKNTYPLKNLYALNGQGSGVNQQTPGHLYSLRYYDGVLNDIQLSANYAIDQMRFIAPPAITLRPVGGGADITNVGCKLVSAVSMTFTVPDASTLGLTTGQSRKYYVIYTFNGQASNTGIITVSNP